MPEVRAAVVSRSGLERPRGGAATGGNLSPAGSMRAPGGVPASLWSDSTLLEVALRTVPQRGGTGGFGAWRGRARAKGSTTGGKKRFEPVRWCTGTRRAGGKMAGTGISGVSALRKCVTSCAGPAGEGRWLRRCWEMSLRACWSVTSTGLTTCIKGLHQRCWTHLRQRCAHARAVPASGTLPAGAVHLRPSPNPGLRWTTTQAERSLRPTVVSRKISGGTRSPEGSNTKSVLASLFGTWRLRGRNPYQGLNSILSKPLLASV